MVLVGMGAILQSPSRLKLKQGPKGGSRIGWKGGEFDPIES